MFRGLNSFFARYRNYGAIFIRLLVGWNLLYGVQDNIFHSERMQEFVDFLTLYHMPAPTWAAPISVYAQAICGICFLLGLLTRPAAIVMIVNFLVAIGLVHLGDTYANTFPALVMLAGSLFLLFQGAGRLSLDERLTRTRIAQVEH